MFQISHDALKPISYTSETGATATAKRQQHALAAAALPVALHTARGGAGAGAVQKKTGGAGLLQAYLDELDVRCCFVL